MAGNFVAYPSLGGSGGSGGLSSISFSIGTLDGGTANQNGASVSSNSIFLQSAGPIFPGLVNSSSQTFSGVKGFLDNVYHKQPVSIGSGFSQALLTISSNTAFVLPPTGTNFHMIGADGAENRLAADTYNALVGGGPGVYLRRARGTGLSPTAVLQDDTLGFFGAVGYGATGFGSVTGGTLSFKASQLWTDTNQGTYFRISLNANSTTTALSRFMITENGTVALSAYVGKTGPMFTTGSGGSLISGSVSLTNQVSGILPAANIGSTTGTPYVVGALDGASAVAAGATITSPSLFMQSASSAFPGLMNTTGQRFSGLKTFTAVGVNDTSSTAALYVKSSSLGLNTLTIQGLSGQTSLGLNIIDNSSNPKVVYDFNAGAFRLFVNPNEAAECNFDNRATVVTGAISSGSLARFNFICSDQSTLGAGKGGGIAFGASQTGSTTVTEFGYVWATKNNANSGDLDGTLHLASRNNATGKAQRGIDIDQNGNSIHFGQVQIAGALNGQINISAGSSVATYTVTMPSSQAVGSTCALLNQGGNLLWAPVNGASVQVISTATGTFTPPAGWQSLKVTVVGGGGQGGGAGTGVAAAAAGGGGGGGGTVITYITVSSNSGQTFAYNIGDGGNTSVSSAAGSVGTSTIFGTTVAFGGGGGAGCGPITAGILGNGGNGGFGMNGDLILRGGGGSYGLVVTATVAVSGVGGGTVFGFNQPPTINTSAGGGTGRLYGGGGSGALQVNNGGNQAGGAGAPGVVVVETFFG